MLRQQKLLRYLKVYVAPSKRFRTFLNLQLALCYLSQAGHFKTNQHAKKWYTIQVY